MADHTPDRTPSVPSQMVRDLGLAPALTGVPLATQLLIECIREDTDLTAERAKKRLARERRESLERNLGPENWGVGTGADEKTGG